MDISKIYPILKENYIFSNIEAKEIETFFSKKNTRLVEFDASEIIFSQNEPISSIGILIDGVAIVGTGNDNALMKPISKGDIFGISNLYSEDDSFPCNIVAKMKCKIFFFDRNDFKEFLESNQQAMKNYIELLNKKIIFLNKKISYLLAGSAEKKLIVFLLENEIDSAVTLNVSMSALADMLNVGRASLYRIFDDLQNDGLIERNSKSIFITDLSALAERL